MEKLILKEYPNARPGEEVTDTYLNFLADNHHCDLKKVLFATSLCCDDINVSTDFRRVLARPFNLGGLGGLPYAGFTGLVAYGHHIPDGGDAFIFYGPHIGITEEGELGKMRRPGQKGLTNSCGALMLALDRLTRTDEVYIPVGDEYDHQQTVLERTLMPFKQQILSAENPVKEITEVAYLVIERQIRYLLERTITEFNCERVFLLGGVIVNSSPEYPDYVEIRNFEKIEVESMRTVTSQTAILSNQAFKNL
ncbi:hypothetical protein SAMN05216436_103136 [bacterium A37T11]|nr:hypothetical protein SAMN05216436_103136 [bacterium A37T11]